MLATPVAFERAISIYRCSYSWVSESRADVPSELGVVWFSQYAPHAAGTVPLYVNSPDIPEGFSSGSLFEFDASVSYWVHAAVGNWADRLYVHTIGDIKALQDKLEDEDNEQVSSSSSNSSSSSSSSSSRTSSRTRITSRRARGVSQRCARVSV